MNYHQVMWKSKIGFAHKETMSSKWIEVFFSPPPPPQLTNKGFKRNANLPKKLQQKNQKFQKYYNQKQIRNKINKPKENIKTMTIQK